MAKQEKTYQWDLKESILGKEETIEHIMDNFKKAYVKLKAIYPNLYKSAKNLKEWIDLYELCRCNRVKAHIFIKQKLDDKPKATKWKSLQNKFDKLDDLDDELFKLQRDLILSKEKQIKKLLKVSYLKEYKRWFDKNFFSFKGHIISKENRNTASAIQGVKLLDLVYEMVEKDINRFRPYACNSKHKIVYGKSFYKLLLDTDPMVRQTAWTNYWNIYYERTNTLASLFYLINYRSNQEAFMYNYPNYQIFHIESVYELDVKKYLDIVYMVRIFKDIHIRYKDHKIGFMNAGFNLKKNVPWNFLPEEVLYPGKYTIKQAKDIVLKAFEYFGKDFVNVCKKILNSKLLRINKAAPGVIDGYTIAGGGVLNKEPIKIDFNGSVSSVATLAHEVCHSASYYFSKRFQKTYKSNNSLLSEIPSLTGEYLCLIYMFCHTKNSREQFAIANYTLINFFALTSYSMYKDIFKFNLNNEYKKHGFLSYKELINVNYLYEEEFCGLTKLEKSWILGKYPQNRYNLRFFANYYDNFFKNDKIEYYIGVIVGICMASDLYTNNNKPTKRFMKFIKSGGSKKPLETLKILKYDILDKKTYLEAKRHITIFLKCFETYRTLNKPGSLRYGRDNKFSKGFKKIK